MALVDEAIEAKARKAMQVLSRNLRVAAAYLFGVPKKRGTLIRGAKSI